MDVFVGPGDDEYSGYLSGPCPNLEVDMAPRDNDQRRELLSVGRSHRDLRWNPIF